MYLHFQTFRFKNQNTSNNSLLVIENNLFIKYAFVSSNLASIQMQGSNVFV